MNNIKDMIDAEIEASMDKAKPIYVKLEKSEDSYIAYLKYKIEGDYVLTSTDLQKDVLVPVEWNEDHIVIKDINIDSDKESIEAYLSKDESAILRAVANNIKGSFAFEPSFIVGPPGTGKTKVIVKILEELMRLGRKVLVTSPTNMAVENVFERIDLNKFNDGDIVLTIKTDHEDLKELSNKQVIERKLRPLMDEIDILQEAKRELHQQKRDLEPKLTSLGSQDDEESILIANKNRDLSVKAQELKKAQHELKGINQRLHSLENNTFLNGIAKKFSDKKMKSLEDEKKEAEEEVAHLEKSCLDIRTDIEKLMNDRNIAQSEITTAKKQISEIASSISKINTRLQELKREGQKLENNNVFDEAKIVGSTLTGAALNNLIQEGKFDVIIGDEISMAPIPTLVAASQALQKREFESVEYEDDESLYEAQNDAVRMALKSQMILVGDPRQLSPIAYTYDMQQSILDYYQVEDIFDGIEVKNTVFLNINFRNHPDITKLASDMFYGGLLKSGKKHDGKPSMYIRRSTSNMVSSANSFVNHGNVSITLTQVRKALQRGRRSIGIITPYRKQADLLNESFDELLAEFPDADLQAGTIHKFQGKEKDVIIYDITYSPSNDSVVPAMYKGNIKSQTAKLLNVAMTRAEGFLILVGNVDGIINLQSKDLVLKDWAKNIQDVYATYKDAA